MRSYHSFDNFRAISIIFIVFSHCVFYLESSENPNFLELLTINLLSGATFFFVFITGYLTPKIFYKKYTYKDFFLQKLKKLLPPYLVLSLPMVGLFITLNKGIFFNYSAIEQFALYIFTGATFAAYWYIPFILFVFALYPLLRKIDSHNNSLIACTAVLILFSIFIQRPVDNINVFHSVIYYLPVYLIGSIVAKNYQLFTKKKFIGLYLIFFLISLFTQSLLGERGNYHSNFFTFNGVDLMFIQKLFLTLFFFSLFENYLNIKITLLKKIADESFGIFFIHMPLILAFSYANKWLNLEQNMLTFIIVSLIMLLMSIFSIFLTKSIIKSKSKYLIGV